MSGENNDEEMNFFSLEDEEELRKNWKSENLKLKLGKKKKTWKNQIEEISLNLS